MDYTTYVDKPRRKHETMAERLQRQSGVAKRRCSVCGGGYLRPWLDTHKQCQPKLPSAALHDARYAARALILSRIPDPHCYCCGERYQARLVIRTYAGKSDWRWLAAHPTIPVEILCANCRTVQGVEGSCSHSGGREDAPYRRNGGEIRANAQTT